MSGCCGGAKQMNEGFNAGNPPLEYGGYPGDDFPSGCGGMYGSYGGCPSVNVNEYDEYLEPTHEPGCACPMCETPYSTAYDAGPEACDCAGCESKHHSEVPKHEVASVTAEIQGKNLIDVGLLNGNGLTAYAQIPFFGVSVNIVQLIKYLVLIAFFAFLAKYLFGFKLLKF